MEARHPDPEISRELQELYNGLPRYEQIVWDAQDDVHKDESESNWSPYKLSEPLLTVWAVCAVQEKTNNGGFQFFFENDWPDCPAYQIFIDAFERISAIETADMLRTSVSAFPSPEPQNDFEMRRNFMETSRSQPDADDSLIDKCGDRVIDLNDQNYRLLSAYVMEHLNCFPTVKRRS